ncbi:STN domain-containing protein, partial [Steroidobacter sp.]|uniref:STN domain-containing protein n=1 Tax=Steroidobacter sp. TaxID=1978227 RepID=UPI001A63817B
MHQKHRRSFALAACGPVASCALAFASLAWSQSNPVDFDLPAQSLEASLKSIAERENLQLVYVSADIAGILAPALKGQYSAVDAITKLTEGTRLVVSYDGKATVVVKPKANQTSGDARLPADASPVQTAALEEVAIESVTVYGRGAETTTRDVP